MDWTLQGALNSYTFTVTPWSILCSSDQGQMLPPAQVSFHPGTSPGLQATHTYLGAEQVFYLELNEILNEEMEGWRNRGGRGTCSERVPEKLLHY